MPLGNLFNYLCICAVAAAMAYSGMQQIDSEIATIFQQVDEALQPPTKKLATWDERTSS